MTNASYQTALAHKSAQELLKHAEMIRGTGNNTELMFVLDKIRKDVTDQADPIRIKANLWAGEFLSSFSNISRKHSVQYLEDGLTGAEQRYGKGSAESLQFLEVLANACKKLPVADKGGLARAEKLGKQLLNGQERNFGSNALELIPTLNLLADIIHEKFYKQQSKQTALWPQEEALRIRAVDIAQKNCGAGSDEVRKTSEKLGRLYTWPGIDEWQKAEPHFRRAYDIERLAAKTDPNHRIGVGHAFAETLFKLGKSDELESVKEQCNGQQWAFRK